LAQILIASGLILIQVSSSSRLDVVVEGLAVILVWQ